MAATEKTDLLILHLHEALEALHAPSRIAHSPLLDEPLAQNFQQTHPTLTPAHALRNLLGDLLTEMGTEQPKLADLLRGHFWEGLSVREMTAQQRPEAQSERRFHTQQAEALTWLAQVWQEATLRLQQEQQRQQLLANLSISSYDALFGAEHWIEEALDRLTDPKGAKVLTLKGNGGIGKTALADAIVRRLIHERSDFTNFIWISAKQEYLSERGIQPTERAISHIRVEDIFDELVRKVGLPQLRGLKLTQQIAGLASLLRVQPHLIVIDNLESVSDFELLTAQLAKLVQPTRILLTSRQTTSATLPIHTVEIEEMQRPTALALIEYVAAQKKVVGIDAEEIYQTVGGNPLALILTISQMKNVPPAVVINNLRKHGDEPLYRYIYWNAWRALAESSQKLLFDIQRAGDEADWFWLTMHNNFSIKQAQQSLSQLFDFSLVNLREQKDGNRIYGIHRLTSTFLRTEVLKWI